MAQVSIDSRCGRHSCMSSETESNKNAADSFYLQTYTVCTYVVYVYMCICVYVYVYVLET